MSIFEHTWLSLSIHVFTWLYLILHNYIMYWRDDHQCIFHRGYMFGFPSTDTMDDLGPINPSCWANSLIKTGMDSGTIVENAKQTSWECGGIYNDIHIYIYIFVHIYPNIMDSSRYFTWYSTTVYPTRGSVPRFGITTRDQARCIKLATFWVSIVMGVSQNVWFIMENHGRSYDNWGLFHGTFY